MRVKSLLHSRALTDYVQLTVTAQTTAQRRLSAYNATFPEGRWQVSPDQGALLAMLVRLISARQCIEVGTFTGYSAMCVASALPIDGRLVACDLSKEWTDIARTYWQEAGVDHLIDLRLGHALDTLQLLRSEEGEESFDFAFVDAEHDLYDAYFEALLPLLRRGGLIVFDNMLPRDPEKDPAGHDNHHMNLKIRDDPRTDASLVAIGTGMMLARKR